MEKMLGKILSVGYGFGGYQEAMFGLSVSLGNDGWGVCDFIGDWVKNDTHLEHVRRISEILEQAKVRTVDQLKDIPVEVTFHHNTLVEWRILTEVL